MRFDIVINDLCALAWTTGKIAMTSDGSPWRPVVHVEDICEAVYRSLLAPEDVIRGKVFNVGQNSENYRVRELAQIVAAEFPGLRRTTGPASQDNRSYRVSFDPHPRTNCPASSASYTAPGWRPAAASTVRAHPDAPGDLPVPRLHAPEAS